MIPEIIDTLGTSIATASIMLAGGYKLTEMMIDRKLAQFEIGLTQRLNGTYVRSSECSMRTDTEQMHHKYVDQRIEDIKRGLERLLELQRTRDREHYDDRE